MPIPQWLKDDLKFSDDEVKVVDPLLTPERVKALEDGHLRQTDYSKKMNELRTAQEAHTAAAGRFELEIAEWATMQANGQKLTKAQQEALNKAEANVLTLQQTVRRIATEAGLDPDKALEGTTVSVKPPDNQPPAPNLDGYVKLDQFGQQIGTLATMALRLPATFARIGREHHALTGQYLNEEAIVAEIERRANTKGNQKSLDPVAIWEEMHAIPEKRDAAATKRHDEEISAAEARGREAAMSEMVTPGPQLPQGRHSPVFQQADGKVRESVLKRDQPGTTHNAAVGALRSHKYRKDGAAKTT